MLFSRPKTSLAVSLAFPFSGTGLLHFFTAAAFFAIERFCEYLMGMHAVALSSGMVVVFALLSGAWFSRCLVVAAESSAEGYDLAPALPSPLEVEELFAALLGMTAVLFCAFAPLALLGILGVRETWALYAAVGLGAAYVPMGILGQAIRGDISGCLPGRVLPAVFAGLHRYLPAAVLTAAAGFLVLVGRDGTLRRMPDFLPWIADGVAAWLLFAAVHRAGVVHREEFAVKALLPPPERVVIREENTIPHRPMSDIERLLREREKEHSPPPPTP